MMLGQDIDDLVSYHAPRSDAERETYVQLRKRCRQLALDISSVTLSSAEQTLAIRALHLANFHANAAVALHGLKSKTLLPDVSPVEWLARIAHEINRTYCEALGYSSQAPWEEAPEWHKQSCMDGVRFLIENPDAGPSASHRNWMDVKVSEGWTYGPEKDPDQKVHPCLVPFEEMPREQQVKDHLFHAVVRLLAGHVV